MATYARLRSESENPSLETQEQPDEDKVEITVVEEPASAVDTEGEQGEQLEIKVSVTNGGAVMDTFDYTCTKGDMTVDDFKVDLESRLEKMQCKLRLLIYRGQILQNGKKLSDYKLKTGDTLQLLTWIPESTAAAAAHSVQQPTPSSDGISAPAGASPRNVVENRLVDAERTAFQFQAGLAHGLALQEEVERWSARVKVWTCMLMLIFSFTLLVGMSESLEQHQQHSSELALSFLGFWVAYIGLRAATRYNFSLARGYFYGQMTVGMCKLFLVAIQDPSVTPGMEGEDKTPLSPNVLFINFAINVVFWAYIVYGAFRFQRALWLWLQDGAPEHIIQSQEEI